MRKFVYLSERQKYIWRNNDWVANQVGTAWDTAIFEDFTKARFATKQDYEYMFDNLFGADINSWFERVHIVEGFNQEAVVGRVSVTWKWHGENYKVIYRITKKFLL